MRVIRLHKNTMVIGIVVALIAASVAVMAVSDSVDASDAGVEYTTSDTNGIIKIYMDDVVPDGNYQVSVVNGAIPSGVTSTAGVYEDHLIIGNPKYLELSGEVSYTVMLVVPGEGTTDVVSGTFNAGVITFDGDGATGSMEPVRAGGTYTLPTNGFEIPTGKEFGGWIVNGVGEPVAAGTTIEITGDMTLTAVWNDSEEPTQATVDFVANGEGSFEITPEGPVTVDVGTPITENGDTLTIGDYTITAKAGENHEFSCWEYSRTSVTEDMTITAVFTETTGTTYYDVTVNQVTGGKATANPARAEAGTTVDLSVDLDEGYVLTGWRVISGDITIANNSFVMPASDVTVEPVIEKITIPVTGVTVSGDKTAIEGTTGQYTATVQPEDATYGDVVWSVNDETVATVDQNGKVRFLTPGPVTITATAGGVSGSITVEVSERSPKSISAVVGVYDEGDTFNWDDVTVTVHYNNGQSETITDGFTIDLADGTLLDTPGTIETTVHYNNMDCTLEVTVRAPGQVAITVNVVGGGLFEGATLYWDDGSKTITTYGTILVDEGTQVTLSCDGLFPPTVTVDGQVVDSYYTFTALKDMTFMVMFPTDDDDDDEPVNPSTPVQDGDDDSTTYIVAIAAAAVVAILAALILMQTRKS